jgi:ParB/RepB/Spo0J family partition protein
MATRMPTRSERKAAVADGVFAPLAKRELLAGLGETVSKRVALTSITPNPNQPRQGVDESAPEFQELVGSIRQQGLIQPISLWQLDEDREDYIIIAGERRWRAYRRLAEEEPQQYGRILAAVSVLTGEDTDAVLSMRGLIENIVRQDLRDGERAAALARLKETTGWSYEVIANRMGMSVNRVVSLSSIARHDVVREAVDDGRITQKQGILLGHGVKDPALAAELVAVVGGLDRAATRHVIETARALPPELPAASRAQTAASGPRHARRPSPLTLPFTWRQTAAGTQLDVAPAALASTRLATQRTVAGWQWLDGLCADLAAFRDACAGADSSTEDWAQAVERVREVMEG